MRHPENEKHCKSISSIIIWPNSKYFQYLFMILALVEVPQSDGNKGSLLSPEDLIFFSRWVDISIDILKNFESSQGAAKTIQDLNDYINMQQNLANPPPLPWPALIKIMKLEGDHVDLEEYNFFFPANLKQGIDIFDAIQDNSTEMDEDLLSKAATTHLSFGQGAVLLKLLNNYLQQSNENKLPSLHWVAPSQEILSKSDFNHNLFTLHISKLFPAQRLALLTRVTKNKNSIQNFVSAMTTRDKTGQTLKYMSTTFFKANLKDVKESLNTLNGDEQMNFINSPKALLNAWNEEGTSFLTSTESDKFDLAMRGSTCSSLESLSHDDNLLEVASTYNYYLTARPNSNLRILTLSLRKCFLDKLKMYFCNETDSVTCSPTSILNKLTLEDIKKIGGYILSGFDWQDIYAMDNKSNMMEIILSIGSISQAQLMPLLTLEQLRKLAEVGSHKSSILTLNDLQQLGTLAYFLPPDKWDLITSEEIKTFLENRQLVNKRRLCLPRYLSTSMAETVTRVYGNPTEWNETTLVSLNELLVVLDSNSLQDLNIKSLLSALPTLLRKRSELDKKFKSFPGFIGQVGFAEACALWLDNKDDIRFYKSADNEVMRTYLLASQLAVDLALGKVGTRRKRDTSDEEGVLTSQTVSQLHEKVVKIMNQRVEEKTISEQEISKIRRLTDSLTNQVQQEVTRVLGLSGPPKDLETFLRVGITSGDISNDKMSLIVESSKEIQREYVIILSQILKLKASDLGLSETVFSTLMRNRFQDQPESQKQENPQDQLQLQLQEQLEEAQDEAQDQQQAQLLLQQELNQQQPQVQIQSQLQSQLQNKDVEKQKAQSEALNQSQVKSQLQQQQNQSQPKIQLHQEQSQSQDQLKTKPEAQPLTQEVDEAGPSLKTEAEVKKSEIRNQNSEFAQNPTPTTSTVSLHLPETTKTKSMIQNDATLNNIIQETEIGLEMSMTLPEKVNCYGVLAAGVAATALRVEDLEPWTSRQIQNCLGILGLIEWPKELKLDVWKFLKFKEVLPKTSITATLLRNLLEATVTQDPDWLSYNLTEDLDTLSLIAEFDLSPGIIESIAKRLVLTNNLDILESFDNKTVFQLVSLGQFICGFPLEIISKLLYSSDDHDHLLQVLGSMKSCPNRDVLTLLANQAEVQIPQPWQPSDVSSLGIILAGLTPDGFASLNRAVLREVSPVVVKHLTPAHLSKLIPEKLASIPPESLAVITLDQLPKSGTTKTLDASQIEALLSSTYSGSALSKVIKQYEYLTTSDAAMIQTRKPIISYSKSTKAKSGFKVLDFFLAYYLQFVFVCHFIFR